MSLEMLSVFDILCRRGSLRGILSWHPHKNTQVIIKKKDVLGERNKESCHRVTYAPYVTAAGWSRRVFTRDFHIPPVRTRMSLAGLAMAVATFGTRLFTCGLRERGKRKRWIR